MPTVFHPTFATPVSRQRLVKKLQNGIKGQPVAATVWLNGVLSLQQEATIWLNGVLSQPQEAEKWLNGVLSLQQETKMWLNVVLSLQQETKIWLNGILSLQQETKMWLNGVLSLQQDATRQQVATAGYQQPLPHSFRKVCGRPVEASVHSVGVTDTPMAALCKPNSLP